MMVMPSNNCAGIIHHWATKYPGLIGHLYSPRGFRGPFPWIPYAIDNGAFGAYIHQKVWDADSFRDLVSRACCISQKPMWIVVPDVVCDAVQTIKMWDLWYPQLQSKGIPLAFAVQDGMESKDVPQCADLVFIGGSDEWKLWAVPHFCNSFAHVHVGRVNHAKRLWFCYKHGVKSVDGTGWMRGDKKQLAVLSDYLARVSGCAEYSQPDLFDSNEKAPSDGGGIRREEEKQ
jgi:hypothetical protein